LHRRKADRPRDRGSRRQPACHQSDVRNLEHQRGQALCPRRAHRAVYASAFHKHSRHLGSARPEQGRRCPHKGRVGNRWRPNRGAAEAGVINDPAHALAEAMKLAGRGIPVFPALLCKDACLNCPIYKKRACLHGFKDPTPNAATLERLWRRFPGQLVGAQTGEASGFDALDIDSAKRPEAIAWYFKHKSMIPLTRTHTTGSGGYHMLFRHDPGARQGQARFGGGGGGRGQGGYIIWWPAFCRKNFHYVSVVGLAPWVVL